MKSFVAAATFLLAALPLIADVSPAEAQPAPPAASPAAPTCPPVTVPAVADAVSKVQTFYDQSTTFTSEFKQKFWVKAHNKEISSDGTVTFAKPGKMVWVYSEPKDNRVVSDGTNLKVYEAANKQMYEQTVDKSQYPAALSFLTGTGKLSDTFNFEVFSGDKMNFCGGYVLVGMPKTATPAYSKVLFYVDAATNQIRRAMVIDAQGNRNRFDFVNPKINEKVDPSRFTFSPPAGTSIIRP
jgi:outer membrane lipoprotein carrier protein